MVYTIFFKSNNSGFFFFGYFRHHVSGRQISGSLLSEDRLSQNSHNFNSRKRQHYSPNDLGEYAKSMSSILQKYFIPSRSTQKLSIIQRQGNSKKKCCNTYQKRKTHKKIFQSRNIAERNKYDQHYLTPSWLIKIAHNGKHTKHIAFSTKAFPLYTVIRHILGQTVISPDSAATKSQSLRVKRRDAMDGWTRFHLVMKKLNARLSGLLYSNRRHSWKWYNPVTSYNFDTLASNIIGK